MALSKAVISFNVFYEGEKVELQTFAGEYRNLMALLYDKIYVEGFGECKGMGRCGSCAVKITGLPETVNIMQRNEEQTLVKQSLLTNNMRLACQVLVDANLENCTIYIPGSESIV